MTEAKVFDCLDCGKPVYLSRSVRINPKTGKGYWEKWDNPEKTVKHDCNRQEPAAPENPAPAVDLTARKDSFKNYVNLASQEIINGQVTIKNALAEDLRIFKDFVELKLGALGEISELLGSQGVQVADIQTMLKKFKKKTK